MSMRLLTLPGWQGSDPAHWQSAWERDHGFRRVQQHDWWTPKRGDWMARLDEEILAEPAPAVLAAHSLGCLLVAAWATHSNHVARVCGALLVAPADVEQSDTPVPLQAWRPIALGSLPFRSTVVASTDDPYCTVARASFFAQRWGASCVVVGPHGHLNSAAGFGDWPDGFDMFQNLFES